MKKRKSNIRYGMQSIDKLVHRIVTPISQRHGFAKAAVLLDWPKIVGPEMQKFCQPVRVSFAPNRRIQGKLHVRVPSAMAQQITYLEPIIIERINGYFGYNAIGRLVLHQQPVFKLAGTSNPKAQKPEAPPIEVDVPNHPDLAAALGRLGRHFKKHSNST